jgi:hypothetical protein
VQTALLFGSASAALSGFLLFFFGATCTGLGSASAALSGFFLLFLDATCAGLRCTSPGLPGLLLLIATGARLAASPAGSSGKGEARPRKQGGNTHARKGFLDVFKIHPFTSLEKQQVNIELQFLPPEFHKGAWIIQALPVR